MQFEVNKNFKRDVLKKVIISNIFQYSLFIVLSTLLLYFKNLYYELYIAIPLITILAIIRTYLSYNKSKKDLSSKYFVENGVLNVKNNNEISKIRIRKIKEIKNQKNSYLIISGRKSVPIPKGIINLKELIIMLEKDLTFTFPLTSGI